MGQGRRTTAAALSVLPTSAEQLNAESADLYRSLVNNMAEGLCLVDDKEFFVMANPAAEHTFGVPEGTLAGRNLREFLDDGQFTVIQQQTERRRRGETSKYEVEIVRPDGSRRSLQLSAAPQLDSTGGFIGAFTVFQDVTERHRMEAELAESERNFRSLYENSPVMLQSIDQFGYLRNVNRKWLAVMGYTREEVIGKRIDDFLAPRGAHLVLRQAMMLIRREGKIDNVHARYKRADGSVIDVEVSATEFSEDDGTLVSLSVLSDITGRLKAEEQLVRLYTAIEQAGECIVVTDPRNRVQFINSAFEKLTGHDRAEALNDEGSFVVESIHQAALALAADALGRGESWEGIVRGRRADGSELDVEGTCSPVCDASGAVTNFVCAYRDVTRERSLQAQLLQAQKMEAVGQMAGGLAHEFNNLLTAIIGNLSLIELEGVASPEFPAYFKDASDAAQRSADLTRQLLVFSRKNTVSFGAADLGEVASQAAKLARYSFPPGLTLALEIEPRSSPVQGDANMLHQIVMNLVLNARDASPHGGRITVTVCPAELPENAMAAAGTYTVVRVADTGDGMDAATRERIFEPFFTTKPAGQGTGLGLAVVYSIVQQHRGWIAVESARGAGTTFEVYLPTTDTAQVVNSPPQTAERGQAQLVLVAEDDPLVSHVVRETLRSHGYEVRCVGNTLDAEHQLDESVELAVMDVQLPGESGLSFWQRVSTAYPKLKVLLISGNDPDVELQAALADGRAVFLPKPFRADMLLRAVGALLNADAAHG